MNVKFIFTAVITLSLFVMPTLADSFQPSHYCNKPYKPYQFSSDYEIQRFNQEVETYKNCMSDFIDEQNDAARKHQRAAEEAIDEWNSFVNYELN